ncbi:nitric oxide reductase transcriptional regulator NorR [Pararobbsia silviterrae]|uniref:Nitric oxide reductase transcriptional regulator NorR n=1 Tax=Pararobbsia silviterrae TaxID=1792498 RepID=A0A494XI30_9BURK|nr:nitric oxide reductase transcriptional regulator NorR [Pararobbsia silviterrae]RKP50198.1 nitric oxide reductase transcriptional regulator NorR [Pararobbsia silviterrae]
MTTSTLLAALIPLVDDLSRDLAESERYQRLLRALRALFPCDAAALLRLDGDMLVPVAIDGLSSDTLGRRFRVSEHPRLRSLLENDGVTRFASDTDLPDPYDGLIQNTHDRLEVHDCMGCALRVGGKPWGLVTLDALDPHRFDSVDLGSLEAFASLASATVNVADHLGALARRGEHEYARAEAYRVAAVGTAHEMIGQSARYRRLVEEIGVVAQSDLTVLITGESGVGKELVAHAIHAGSTRADKPLISLNCAALPETLVESELFGHVRGAFSGAIGDRRGKFDLANGGTLFLDEVGELPLAIQAKLLRVLQSGQLQRLGSDREHRVDVRLIAATNRNLADEVRHGRYRADFYHRLSVYPLNVPPLRERGRDVLLIAGGLLEQNRARLGLQGIRLSNDAQAALLAYPWPGNVRELEHLIGRSALRALAVATPRPKILTLRAADLDLSTYAAPRDMRHEGEHESEHEDEHEAQHTAPHDAPRDAPNDGARETPAKDLRQALLDYERTLIRDALERHAQSWSAAARELGVDRANLSRSAKRLGLK